MEPRLQGIYRPRDPKASDFYGCVEDYFEELERVYDEKYQIWEVPKRSTPSTTPPCDFVYDPHFFAGLTG